MKRAILIAPALATAVIITSPIAALADSPSNIDVKQVSGIAEFIFSAATCEDFTNSLTRYGKPDATPQEEITAVLLATFMEGYANGLGEGGKGRTSFLIDCMANPKRKLNTLIAP